MGIPHLHNKILWDNARVNELVRPAPQHFCGAKGPKINGYVLDNSRYKFYVSYVDPHKNNAISCIILCCGGVIAPQVITAVF